VQRTVHVQWDDYTPTSLNTSLGREVCAEIVVTMPKRGDYHCRRLCVWSTFPLGLFFTWTWFEVEAEVLVYPKPMTYRLLYSEAIASDKGKRLQNIQDDFYGLRRYVAGDSPRHIAWRLYAQEKGLYTKQFVTNVAEDCWLDWDSLPTMPVEQKLSILCYWILNCATEQLPFGLKMPAVVVPVNCGPVHQHLCLRLLALYQQKENNS